MDLRRRHARVRHRGLRDRTGLMLGTRSRGALAEWKIRRLRHRHVRECARDPLVSGIVPAMLRRSRVIIFVRAVEGLPEGCQYSVRSCELRVCPGFLVEAVVRVGHARGSWRFVSSI
ncbi:hypothetical protein ACIBI9_00965 [Nonomuraea sp. NPDC050451]|uniref:hypothetical protein n=1 Tax=Nonomuraea sp. NPDC050451 TaxID=3364364 RepID=UPI0037A49D4C